jgi:hypothetical protein
VEQIGIGGGGGVSSVSGKALGPVLEQVGQQVAHRDFPATAVLSATAHDLGVFGRAEGLALAAGRADALLQPCALGLPELEPGCRPLRISASRFTRRCPRSGARRAARGRAGMGEGKAGRC